MTHKAKKVKVGIMPLKDFKKRTIAIARGDYKPTRNEPKIWFNSIKSLANVLSEKNQALLRLIADVEPQSISELEQLTGRKANNLLRTLHMMENYGFVKLHQGKSGNPGRNPLIPCVIYNTVEIEIKINRAT